MHIHAGGVQNILMFYIHRAYIIHCYIFSTPHTLKAWEDERGYFGQKSFHISPLLFDMFIVSSHGFPQAIHECLISLARFHTCIVGKRNYVFEQLHLEQIPVADSLWSHKA